MKTYHKTSLPLSLFIPPPGSFDQGGICASLSIGSSTAPWGISAHTNLCVSWHADAFKSCPGPAGSGPCSRGIFRCRKVLVVVGYYVGCQRNGSSLSLKQEGYTVTLLLCPAPVQVCLCVHRKWVILGFVLFFFTGRQAIFAAFERGKDNISQTFQIVLLSEFLCLFYVDGLGNFTTKLERLKLV